MKAADIRMKSVDELNQHIQDLKKESLNLRFQRASGQLESTSRIRAVRRDIARIRTILNQKQSAS
jgi:large subunit ribosomal protein L29